MTNEQVRMLAEDATYEWEVQMCQVANHAVTPRHAFDAHKGTYFRWNIKLAEIAIDKLLREQEFRLSSTTKTTKD